VHQGGLSKHWQPGHLPQGGHDTVRKAKRVRWLELQLQARTACRHQDRDFSVGGDLTRLDHAVDAYPAVQRRRSRGSQHLR
jgi:hypothetical protein